ncbi:hypothetical protein RI129_009541 [Pyrocoelia pectoralis]|uniref:CHK kinase-like domain-containing protein n=1 Tax=Pyrocoelia pectoralis TaxID=417401 RepID=A0AAN7VBT4_9COLE
MVLLQDVFTKKYLQGVFIRYFKQDVEILNIDLDNLLKPGENYCSEMKNILLTFKIGGKKERKLSVVAKCFPENEYTAQFVKEMRFFDCELAFYGTILPKLRTLDYREKITPKVYSCRTKPIPVVILEDLRKLDFTLAPREVGLDLKHCLLVMEKLAYLHASSFALQQQDSSLFEEFTKCIFRKVGIMHTLMEICYDEIVEICKRISELQPYADKIKAAKEHVFNKMYSVHHINSKFKVLNHGDCWINNILFYYENGNVTDLRFVDFQNSCYASPCLDLHYFLSCSLKYDIRDQKDAIINHYFKNLLKILEKLHVKTFPNREEFDKDFRSMGYIGFGGAILTLALCKVKQVEDANAQSFVKDDGENSFRHHCFHNKDYEREVMHFVPFYDNLGIFTT